MTRRIWHCIKSHLRPYSTNPFNWDKNDKPDGSQWQWVQKLSASPKYQKLHELVCERNEKCIVIVVKTHYFLTNYFLISTIHISIQLNEREGYQRSQYPNWGYPPTTRPDHNNRNSVPYSFPTVHCFFLRRAEFVNNKRLQDRALPFIILIQKD